MARQVSDTDEIRRRNRGLVLGAIRRVGPIPRTRLATETGLSNATISAISNDMIAQNLLDDLPEVSLELKTRGRPPVNIGFNRAAGYALLFEVDVNKARCSLVDYGGTLVDRTEVGLSPSTFAEIEPARFFSERVENIKERNPREAKRIMRLAISLQGILDREETGLKWSPVAHISGHDIVGPLQSALRMPVTLFKRGRLLAEGTRWLFPDLRQANVATVFVGSTVAMGVSLPGENEGRRADAATEFGHMNHVPDGALCRCGQLGCIEAYASDYGVLRTAYGVPENTPPAPAVPSAQYTALIERAQAGDRDVIHAFNVAGKAVGYGLNRLMSVFDISHIVIIGPGAIAYPMMQMEMENGLATSLMAQVHGTPDVLTHTDENEPVFRGLMMKTLVELDQSDFAALPSRNSAGAS